VQAHECGGTTTINSSRRGTIYARAVTIQLQSDKIDNAGEIVEEVAVSLQDNPGFHEATLLADTTTRHGQIITLRHSEEALRASETTVYQQAMARLAATFAAPPKREILNVIMRAHQGQN